MNSQQFQSDLLVRPELCGSPMLLSPFAAHISSQRLMMLSSNAPQIMILNGCECAKIQSGYETKYGKYEFDLSTRDQDIQIVSVIPKFKIQGGARQVGTNPLLTVIYVGADDGKIGYFDVASYTELHSGFGYINKRLNTYQLSKGNFVAKETKFLTAPNHDGQIYMMGTNANVCYLPMAETTEDAFVISKRLQQKMEHPVISSVTLAVRPDDIPLNCYGTEEGVYKAFPDVGEQVREDGILMAFRSLNGQSFLSDTTAEALSQPSFLHDDVYVAAPGATIVDVEIFTNQKIYAKYQELDGAYSQMMSYQDQYHDYYAAIIDTYETLKAEGRKLRPEMNNLITRCRGLCYHRGGKSMTLMNKKEPVDFIQLKITYAYNRKISKGYKLTGRDGAKGVVSAVWENEDMPMTLDGHSFADIMITGESPFNRLNIGQLYETFITGAAHEVVYRIKESFDETKYNAAFETMMDFINDIRPVFAQFLRSRLKTQDARDQYVDDVLADGIHLIIPQFCDNITPKMILAVAKKWGIERQRLRYRKTMPNGEKIEIVTKHKGLIGSKYLYLLGKIPMDQMNAIEFGFTNQFRTPIKPNSKNTSAQCMFGQTPIRLGEDEIAVKTLSMGPETVARFMGVYANSPTALTMLQKELLTNPNPTKLQHINMSLDEIISTNSNISIFKHQLALTGYELKRVKSSFDNPGIQPAPFTIPVPTKHIEHGAPSCLLKLHTPLIVNETVKDFSMPRLTFEQYSTPYFVDDMMHQNQVYGFVELVLGDNVVIKMPKRLAWLNIMFWESLLQFGLKPTSKDIFNIKFMTADSVCVIQSKVYKKLLDECPDMSYIDMITTLWFNINRLYQFFQIFCGGYMPTMDVLGLSRLMNQPKFKELAEYKFDQKMGTKVAETIQKAHSKELFQLLATEGDVEENILRPYMEAGVLKKNQIPQALLAYCCRSDVDDTMRSWIISESSLSGLRCVNDFATESLSAKKSLYFSRDVIKKSQYWGRKMRLACSTQRYIYPGSCGSTMTIPFIINPSWSQNYVHRIIEVDGKEVILTKANISEYEGKVVNLISPFGCKHTNGICERCAGYAEGRLLKYTPPGIHIGLLASTKISSVVSQKVLSAKHLISTDSKMYNLPESAQRYFTRSGDCIFWDKKWKKDMKHFSIRIPTDAINPITDLNMDTLPAGETFSKLSYIEIVRDNDACDTVQLEADLFIPYLSDSTLEYIRSIFPQIVQEEGSVTIPLHGIDINKEFMKYIILNDDMITYTKRVNGFLSKQIAEYHSVASVITDFATLVYSKSEINSFFLEMVLRTFMIQDPNTFIIPIIEDPDKVHFANLDSAITESSVSGKLGFERLGDWLKNPATALFPKPQGLFSLYFGL